jgi:hypothetical protein
MFMQFVVVGRTKIGGESVAKDELSVPRHHAGFQLE